MSLISGKNKLRRVPLNFGGLNEESRMAPYDDDEDCWMAPPLMVLC
jgi:hypothetical protein